MVEIGFMICEVMMRYGDGVRAMRDSVFIIWGNVHVSSVMLGIWLRGVPLMTHSVKIRSYFHGSHT